MNECFVEISNVASICKCIQHERRCILDVMQYLASRLSMVKASLGLCIGDYNDLHRCVGDNAINALRHLLCLPLEDARRSSQCPDLVIAKYIRKDRHLTKKCCIFVELKLNIRSRKLTYRWSELENECVNKFNSRCCTTIRDACSCTYVQRFYVSILPENIVKDLRRRKHRRKTDTSSANVMKLSLEELIDLVNRS